MASRYRLLLHNTKFVLCAGLILSIVFFGFLGRFFTSDPGEYVGKKYESPSQEYWLGTDALGRDVFAQLVHGIWNSIIVGFIAGSTAAGLAILIGGLGGYLGGLTDKFANLACNIGLTVPMIPILILLAVLFEARSLLLVALIISLTSWPGAARAIRSQILSLKERNFVDLAIISGKGDFEIFTTELLPNMLAYIFIQFVSMLGGAIMAEAGISLIGLGPTDSFSLGRILHMAIRNQALSQGIWWWFIPAGLIIVILTGTLVMTGSIIDQELNPRLRGVEG